MRAGAPPQFSAHENVEVAEVGGVRVAALSHTSRRGCAAELLQAYRRGGAQAVHARAFDCAAVITDARARRVVLTRDFAGTTPLYYAVNQNGFGFGTQIADVCAALALRPTPARRALAALLVDHSAPASSETYFDEVSAVAPGGTLVRHDSQHAVLGAVSGPTVAPTRISYHDAVAQFRDHLHRAVLERVDAHTPTAVLVSGGLDSSALLALAVRWGNAFGITYGPSDDPAADESRYIDVLRAHGVRIERVPFYPTVDRASLEQSVREAEVPQSDIVPLTLARAKQCAREQGSRALLLGTWGDQVLSPFPPPHHARLSPRRAAARAARYHRYLADVSLSEVRHALVRQSMRARLPAWLRHAIRRRRRRAALFDVLAAEFPPAARSAAPCSYAEAVHANVCAPEQVQAIEGTTKWATASGLDVRLPFVDRELVSFLLSLPDEVAYHDDQLKPLLRDGLRGIVPDVILDRRDKGDYTAVIRRHQLPLDTALELLEDLRRLIDFGLLSRARAAKTLAQLRQGANIANDRADMMVLLSVDTWLRLFF